MTEAPKGIAGTLDIIETYRAWVVSGDLDAMPADRRRALLIRLLDQFTEFAVGAAEMQASIAALLETRKAVREAAAAAGLVEGFVPAPDTIGDAKGSA